MRLSFASSCDQTNPTQAMRVTEHGSRLTHSDPFHPCERRQKLRAGSGECQLRDEGSAASVPTCRIGRRSWHQSCAPGAPFNKSCQTGQLVFMTYSVATRQPTSPRGSLS